MHVVVLWGCRLLNAAVTGSVSGGRCALCCSMCMLWLVIHTRACMMRQTEPNKNVALVQCLSAHGSPTHPIQRRGLHIFEMQINFNL